VIWSFGRWNLAFPRSRDRFSCFFVGSAAAFGFALVPELLTLAWGNFTFTSAFLEYIRRGIQGRAVLLVLAVWLLVLSLVSQQFAGAERGMVVDVAVLVGADMAVEQPQFAVFDEPVGVFQVDQA